MSLQQDAENFSFNIAADFVHHTDRHVFLTGKAGTGKTTFLKHIRNTCFKNMVVAAPTGVAAINAGGVTLHALFQLPFGSFIPERPHGFDEINANYPEELIRKIRMGSNKKELLREIELLIIDEVSMMRADMLDAMDTILRHVREKPFLPFGGIQVLFIGDLFQLPPVVNQEEWKLLSKYYESPFFFHARVMQQCETLQIELKKIYRQNEQYFIDILNRVRTDQVLPEDLLKLNNQYNPHFLNDENENIITLTSHNFKADQLNNQGLKNLHGKEYIFEGIIKDDYNENTLPTEKMLTLKEGAQVMFIKNDSGESRRFFNGKLAKITRIEEEEIYILPFGETDEWKLEKETWKNIRYVYNKSTHTIEEEELGSFTQYPIRLAWAITIHKSQGLTFEKAVIDAGQSFTAGQVYVALSRCTTLEGITLLSKIQRSSIKTNEQILAFAENESPLQQLEIILNQEKLEFSIKQMFRLFDWSGIIESIRNLLPLLQNPELEDPLYPQNLFRELLEKANYHKSISEKLIIQLQYFCKDKNNIDALSIKAKLNAGIPWFIQSIKEDLIAPMETYIKSIRHKSKIKSYFNTLLKTETIFREKNTLLQKASFPEFSYQALEAEEIIQDKAQTIVPKPKKEKGASQKESLRLFKEGHSIDEIATLRSLVPGTILQHLMSFITSGEIATRELIAEEKLYKILDALNSQREEETLTALKERLNNEFSFEEIRLALFHKKWMENSN